MFPTAKGQFVIFYALSWIENYSTLGKWKLINWGFFVWFFVGKKKVVEQTDLEPVDY